MHRDFRRTMPAAAEPQRRKGFASMRSSTKRLYSLALSCCGTRNRNEGWTVISNDMSVPYSFSFPRLAMTGVVRPRSERTAVAPIATRRRGATSSISRLSQSVTGVNFRIHRLLVHTALAAKSIFEMLHGVGDINSLTRNIGLCQCACQKLTSRADEWPACNVFLIARLFADEHDRCAARAFSKNRLRRILPEGTCMAIRGCVPQGFN